MGQAILARRRRLWTAAYGLVNIAYTAVITSLALTPTPPSFRGASDWLLHGMGFALQSALLYGLLRTRLLPVTSMLAAGAAAICYGGVIEVLQLGVPGRFFEVSDLVANSVGVAVSIAMLAVWERWLRDTTRAVSG